MVEQTEKEKAREVHLIGDVNEANIRRLFDEIRELHRRDPSAPIRLYVTSPGGAPPLACAFYDWVRITGVNLETIALGDTDSAALIILLSGRKRKATKNSLLLIHNVMRNWNKGVSFRPYEAEALAADLAKTQRILDEIIAERTGKKVEEIEEQKRKDVSFTAEEAKAFGLIEEIL